LIVFASVARLAEHFEEDFRNWNSLAKNAGQGKSTGKEKRLEKHQRPRRSSLLKSDNRRDSLNSLKSSPRIDSPISMLRSAASFSQGPDSSDMGDYEDYYSDDYSSQHSSPPKRHITIPSSAKKTVVAGLDTHSHRESIKAFKAAVDEDQSMNVLMEINASGKISYISPAVQKVFQYSPMEIISSNTLLFLAPGDDEKAELKNPFKEAALNSVRERPNLEICIDAKRADGRSIKVECHGLANYDNTTGLIQNVVWLMRPVKLARAEDSPSLLTSEFINRFSESEMIPNLDMALCNICDKSVPAIHFSIHTEICLKVHKTEMELMLLNDEMKGLRKNIGEKIDMLNHEINLMKSEILETQSKTGSTAGVDTDVVSHGTLCEFYSKLVGFGGNLQTCLEQLLQIKIPKQEFLGISYDDLFDAVVWNLLNDSDYTCPLDAFGFGADFQQFAKSFQIIFDQKRNQTNQLIDQLLAYLECLEAELLLTIEIGLQAGSISNSDANSDLKEIGGVMVNVPSMQNLDSSAPSGKESLFFQNQYQPQSPSSPLATAYIVPESDTEPALPEESLSSESSSSFLKSSNSIPRKKNSKPAVLRIQTDQDAVDQNSFRRSSSTRNTRMVVGDKSIEVDLEAILTPSRSSSNWNTLISPRASQFNPASPQLPVAPSAGSPSTSTPSSRSTSYSHTHQTSFHPASPVQRGTSFQPIRATSMSRQISFSTVSVTPSGANLGSNSSLALPRTFSISSGVSPSTAVSQPSIKDYEIIKPISKGAFGSVFLAKKKISGQYFAIKVLRKADMVAKNQASNIKSERTILTQLDSPYVVKLFSTFQSKNHIYLVMEYLNGGDCAALLKSMGQLDEDWARQYITEMVEGLAFLHERDIVHR
jgi:PAS domain-containing protein